MNDRIYINGLWALVVMVSVILALGAYRDKPLSKRDASLALAQEIGDAARKPAKVAAPMPTPAQETKPEIKAVGALPPLALFADSSRVVPADGIQIILFEDGTLKWSPRKAPASAESPRK